MSDLHNHEHAKENKGVGPANSLRTVIGVIVSIIAVCLVMFAIFRVYSNELSDEFYDLAASAWTIIRLRKKWKSSRSSAR